jgi:hypothetical protein
MMIIYNIDMIRVGIDCKSTSKTCFGRGFQERLSEKLWSSAGDARQESPRYVVDGDNTLARVYGNGESVLVDDGYTRR